VFVLVVPLGYAAYSSLFATSLLKGLHFVGLDNYKAAFQDQVLIDGVLRVLRFFAIEVPVMLGLAVLFALALDSGRLRFMRSIRLAIFLPYAVPSVVGALMWGYLYGHDYGMINSVGTSLSLPRFDFFGPGLVLSALANVQVWEYAGYNMIILFAALRAVPTELYEAAEVDGAGAWRIAWSIKIPALRPALILTLMFSVVGTLQLFNEPFVLQNSSNFIKTSAGYTPNLYAYNVAFNNQDDNYAAALSFVLAIVILVISYVVLMLINRRSMRNMP
jgi:multiple sugar transport system permease protein